MSITLRFLAPFLLTPALAFGITNGQVDDFQSGTVQNWAEGNPSPNPPTVVLNSGPLGAGDHALQDISNGTLGAGGRQVMFNQSQWTGDYVAAGVTGIELMIMVPSSSVPLDLRIAIRDGSTDYGSTNAVPVAADNQWHLASFGLASGDMTLIGGVDSLNTVLSGVTELRILSANAGPALIGDSIASEMNIDNITAVPEPCTASLVALGALMLGRARRRRHAR